MIHGRVVVSVLAIVGALWLSTVPGWAQQPESDKRTVHDGVYTAGQAERGKSQYESFCMRCHGEDLTGANARPLVGEDFNRNWTGLALDGLLERAESMPPGAAGSLGTAVYVDIISYVLQTNGFPAGDGELEAAELASVWVEGEDGPGEVPDNTLVQVVGCLSQADGGTWIVNDATEPIRTRDPAASVELAQQVLASQGLGEGSYELMYVFPSPDGLVGHTVEAKGFLIRGDQDRLNVTSVASVTSTCRR